MNTLRSKLVLLIIDEVSMVGANMLLEIHKRLQQIKSVLPDVMFGGVSVSVLVTCINCLRSLSLCYSVIVMHSCTDLVRCGKTSLNC